MTQEFFRRIECPDNTYVRIEWLTDWMLGMGVDTIRMAIKNFNITNLNTSIYIQTADCRPSKPNAQQALWVSAQAGNGESNAGGDLTVPGSPSPITATAMWFRLGLGYQPSAASRGTGDVSLIASWRQFGDILDTRTVMLNAPDTSNRVEVLSPWIPARHGFGSAELHHRDPRELIQSTV